ncbi:MAG: hypothetical protein ABJD02_09925 [Paraglaciecola sp.]|uniref:hypothetical protein n=1 Tax=Paraglaciecola sp. TaxID=1920173 RepID=UPI0032679644
MKLFFLTITILVGAIWWFIHSNAPTAKLEYIDSDVTSVTLEYTGHATYYSLASMKKIDEVLENTSLPDQLLYIDKLPSFQTKYDEIGPIVSKGSIIKAYGTHIFYTPSKLFPTGGKMTLTLVEFDDEMFWMNTLGLRELRSPQ